MIRPDKGQYPITQGFGANAGLYGYDAAGHTGIDIGTPVNTPLLAGITGTVIAVGETRNWGKHIKIAANGFTVYTGHMNRVDVGLGQNVTEGQVIGLSGNTGFIPGSNQRVGPHFHWEVTYNGKLINPLDVLSGGDEMYKEMAEDRLNTIRNYEREKADLVKLAEDRLKDIQTLGKEKEELRTIAEDRLNTINNYQKALDQTKAELDKKPDNKTVADLVRKLIEVCKGA